MKIAIKSLAIIFSIFLISCGGKEEKKKERDTEDSTKATEATVSETVNLSDKGVGPITSVSLDDEIDVILAEDGAVVYNQMCLPCHKVGEDFIGPDPTGILERRSPEWIMNMILDPEKMVIEDAVAKKLLAEHGTPMSNQALTEDQARSVLEFFRTLK